MAQRVIGWISQISDEQFMAMRSPDLGSSTTYHKSFGLAKTAIEQSVSHSTTAVKSDTAVPARWTLYDSVIALPTVEITSPLQDAMVIYPGDMTIEFTSTNATSWEAFGSFNGGGFVSLGAGASPIVYPLQLADVGTFEIYVVATGADGVTSSTHVSGTVLNAN